MKGFKIPSIQRKQLPQQLRWLEAYDLLFFLSFGLFLVTSILSASFYYRYFAGRPYTILLLLCMALLAAYEFHNGGFKNQHWVGFAVAVGLFLLSLMVSEGNLRRQVPLMFAYIYCARNIPFGKVARFSLNVSILTVFVIVFSSLLGIIDNVVVAKGDRIREFLGFRYALYLPGILLNMTALWVYLRRDSITIAEALLWGVLNGVVFYLTDSRISFFLAEGLLLAGVLMRYFPKVVEKLHVLWGVMASSFVFFGGLSVFMTAIYDSTIPWMRKLNSMLESRLRLGHRSLERDGIPFFGQQIEWFGNGLDEFGNSVTGVYTYVDCLYVKILQRYGFLFTAMLMVLLCWAMYRLWKRREYHILLISASVAAHCVLDDLSFALHYNTFWIAMGVVLLNPAALEWRKPRLAPPDPEKQSE